MIWVLLDWLWSDLIHVLVWYAGISYLGCQSVMAYTRVHIVLVPTGNVCKYNLNSQSSIQLLCNVSFSNLVCANIYILKWGCRSVDVPTWGGWVPIINVCSTILQNVKLLVSKRIWYNFQCKICHSFNEISSASGGETPGPQWCNTSYRPL